eukprot:m.101538 g.101538  ORF g.101538 m.101538 type:complete len:817 (-) comp13202_c1_seq4:172-2622(-)
MQFNTSSSRMLNSHFMSQPQRVCTPAQCHNHVQMLRRVLHTLPVNAVFKKSKEGVWSHFCFTLCSLHYLVETPFTQRCARLHLPSILASSHLFSFVITYLFALSLHFPDDTMAGASSQLDDGSAQPTAKSMDQHESIPNSVNGAKATDLMLADDVDSDSDSDSDSDGTMKTSLGGAGFGVGLDDEDPLDNVEPFSRAGYLKEFRELFALMWPTMLAFLFQMLMSIVMIAFVGHYNTTLELDVVGLGASFANVFGNSVGVGFASAADTLGAQGWGSSNKKVVGLVLQRGLCILSLVMLPCAAVWLCAEPMLLAFQQDPQVAKLTGHFNRVALGTLPLNYVWILLQKYLQAQNIVKPLFFIGLGTNVLNVLFCYLFIGVWDFGYIGAAIVQTLNVACLATGALVYIYKSKVYVSTWPGWTKAALLDWKPYIKLAIPGMLMLCCEWWCFEFCQFLAGVFGEVSIAVNVIMMQVAAFLFMSPLGMGIASSIRVGNLLGANKPKLAKQAAYVTGFVLVCELIFSTILLLTAKRGIPRIYSKDPNVIDQAASLFHILSIFCLFDHIQGALSGILRGCGLQNYGAVYNVIGYYVVGAPMVGILAFAKGMELRGIWIGLLLASMVQSVAIALKVFFGTDFNQMAADATKRLEESAKIEEERADEEKGKARQGSPVELNDMRPVRSSKTDPLETRGEDSEIEEDEGGDDGQALLSVEDSLEAVLFEGVEIHIPSHIKRDRVLGLLLCVSLLGAAVVGMAVYTPPHICSDLPIIDNSTTICERFSSLLAGGTCNATCTAGFELHGVYNCSLTGELTAVPSCDPIPS